MVGYGPSRFSFDVGFLSSTIIAVLVAQESFPSRPTKFQFSQVIENACIQAFQRDNATPYQRARVPPPLGYPRPTPTARNGENRVAKKMLTEAGLERLRAPEKGRVELGDSVVPGLMLRISETGVKSWSVRYKVKGEGGASVKTGRPLKGTQRRISLGLYSHIMNHAMEFGFLTGLPRVFLYVARAAWTITFVGMVSRLARGLTGAHRSV